MSTTENVVSHKISLEDIPLMRSAVRSPSSLDSAIELVLVAIERGSICYVSYQDIKFKIVQAALDAWRVHVSTPFFDAGKRDTLPQDVVNLYDSINVGGLRDVIRSANRVAKSKAKGPAVDAMRAYFSEVLPLAEAVAALRNKVYKSRGTSASVS